ncbi:hypothetical protein RBI22_16410 [Alcaligenaceae bacterium C4P045]|nr:hypothetical protein [Alcaligenaceae bacterium B3P038]MDQ2150296.1 hypothetical protein [Alcaligenaceae bacterium C4P045]
MHHRDDDTIPTLTIAVDPPEATADALPLLTELAPAAPSGDKSAVSAHESLLRVTLQAEIDDAVHRAMDDALAQVRATLDAQLPDIIERVLRKVRPG